MTETSLRCADCDRPLEADDQFCSRCGTPTAANPNAQATVVDEVEPSASGRAGREGEDTIPEEVPPPAPPSGMEFNERFRHVLGEEFELLALIGQGGFARVYRARDRRLDRIVAIKVIKPNLAGNEAFMDSFRSEGVALAKLRHPGIIPIYNIRERGGLIYYIMPFVEGTTLEERLLQGRMPPFESRRILSELADALSAAHRANMVHLDIKPENVFLEGDHQKVLLMDFGIAMHLAEKVPDSGGPVVGTPLYMSPEQARGLADIDHRSDIYSLGALGYRLLMGRPPYRATSIPDVVKRHAAETPVPIRDINPTIPKDLADAVMKCLEKDPWDRFSTAKEFAGVLELVTFSTQRDTAPHAVATGVHGTLVVLYAALALLLGLVIGQVLG